MTFLTRNFDPLTPLVPKFPNFAIQILLFRLKHTLAVGTHAHVLQNFYTTWVRGVACQKQRVGPKLEGGWARGASKKFRIPYVFLQPLKLATSNLVYNLGLGLSYQKTQRLGPKLAEAWARGASKKFRTPYLFLKPLKLATEKLVHNMSSGLPCQTEVLVPN